MATIRTLPTGERSGLGAVDVRYEHLLWDVALYSSMGRLPTGVAPDVPYRLTRWPDLARVTLIPDATRLAAYWTQGARTIDEVGQVLGIDDASVASFFSAAEAVDLMVREDEGRGHRRSRQPSGRRRLLSRLIGRLRAA